MTPSLEGWPTKAKEAPFPHEVRMSPLDTNPVFQSLGGKNVVMLNQLPLRSKCNKRICANFRSVFFHLLFASIAAQRQTKEEKSKNYS